MCPVEAGIDALEKPPEVAGAPPTMGKLPTVVPKVAFVRAKAFDRASKMGGFPNGAFQGYPVE